MSGITKRAYGFVLTGCPATGLSNIAPAAQLELHGCSDRDYVQANGNSYLGADGNGAWSNSVLGLVGAAAVNEKINYGCERDWLTHR